MNDERDLSPDELRARDAVRALPAVAPSAEYRARLRRAFAAGTLAAPPRAEGPPIALGAWRWAAIPLAAAAAFVLVSTLNRGPAWQLALVQGEGVVVVDGRPVPLTHTDELARRVRPGARVRVPEGAVLEIMSPGTLCIEITPGTDLAIPEVPGRWWARRVRGELTSGEIRITSGRRFHGARLAFSTPEARIEVTGTTLAVIREPGGTCVCVLEGRVMVGPNVGDMLPVERGMRRFVFNDARPVEVAAMREAERAKLGMFRANRAQPMELP